MEMDLNVSFVLLGNLSEQNVSDVPTQSGHIQWYESGRIQIPLYCIIFMLAITGNCLVILTLVSNFFIKNCG